MSRSLITMGWIIGFVAVPQALQGEPPGEHDAAAGATGNRFRAISPEEREAMGLEEPTWTAEHGKVHPNVYKALEKDELPWLPLLGSQRVGFQGTAYVKIYLRHVQRGKVTSEENRAAIKEVQSRVLSKLTAAEFSLRFRFESSAGLIGHASSPGLAKLAKNPHVIAVGLDNKLVPKDPPQITREEPPRPKPGQKPIQTPIERIGKVEAAVYTALSNSSDRYVYVIVVLNQGVSQEAPHEEKVAADRRIQDRVLSGLSAYEFRTRIRIPAVGLHGCVNTAGLAKLEKQQEVVAVDLLPPPVIKLRHPIIIDRKNSKAARTEARSPSLENRSD